MAAAMAAAAAATAAARAAAMTAAKRAAAEVAAAAATRRRDDEGDEEGRAVVARAAPGVPLGAWLEPHPSGLRVRSGGLSRRSEPLDHLQAAGSLSMHRELCAHSPTGAQSAQAIGMPGTPGEQAARPVAVAERAPGRAMARRTKRPQPARPPERPEHLFRAAVHLTECWSAAVCATVVKKIDWSKLTNYVPL